MIPILRAIRDSQYKKVVGILSAQTGKTDSILNAIGHRTDDDPAPSLYVGPTRSNVEKVIEPRLMAMIESAESLKEKYCEGKKSSKTCKLISGVTIRLAWSGSATELAAQPASDVYVDERDRMTDILGEGDVVTLADARHSTYPDGTTIVTSTPLTGNVEEITDEETGLTHWELTDAEDIQSPIWKLWQEGTRYEWAWPCPDCKDYFIPRFKLLQWPKDSTPYQALQKARLCCPNCGSMISEKHKSWMNARGVYVAPGQKIEQDGTVLGEVEDNTTASFWVSGLCSPWRSFGQRAREWLDAVNSGDQGRIQAVINTGFGELYKLGSDSPDWNLVRERCLPYKSGTLPAKILALILTVDVQKDRLEYVIRGWSYGMESWLIEQGELYGETEYDPVWNDLEDLLYSPIENKNIRLCLIDSGYHPGDKHKKPKNMIYDFCRRHRSIARATKGSPDPDQPVKRSLIDISYGGRIIKRGLQLWHLDTGFCKGFVYSRIEPPEGQPDLWHLPDDITDAYCKQVTAEALVHKPSGQSVWIRNRKDNHKLDCEGMQIAGAYMLYLHKKTRPRGAPPPMIVGAKDGEQPQQPDQAELEAKKRQARPQKKRRRTIRSPSLR